MIRWAGFPDWADWTDSKPIQDFEPKSFQLLQSNDPIYYSNAILAISLSNFQRKLPWKKWKAKQIEAALSAYLKPVIKLANIPFALSGIYSPLNKTCDLMKNNIFRKKKHKRITKMGFH